MRMRLVGPFLVSVLTLSACEPPAEVEKDSAKKERILEASKYWPSEPDYSVKLVALSPLGNDGASGTMRPVFNPSDDYWGLPRTGEFELVAAYCAGCHSIEIIMQQRASRERWEYMLTWMSEKQGMVPLDGEDRELVLDYLVLNFGP